MIAEVTRCCATNWGMSCLDTDHPPAYMPPSVRGETTRCHAAFVAIGVIDAGWDV